MSQLDHVCPSCKAPHVMRPVYVKDGVQIVRCGTCGLGMSLASEFDPDAYYDESYFNGNRTDGYSDYTSAREVLVEQFGSEHRLLARLGATGGTLLEVGCAYGYFLETARRQFDVHGLEICEEAVLDCQSRGLAKVRHGALTQETAAGFPPADVIVMLDVIEHLPDPFEALSLLAATLKPGGRLLITTGDFASLAARISGKQWRLMTPPQHLWFFTPQALEQSAEKLGLTLEYIDHPPKKVPLGLIAYQLARYLGWHPTLPGWMHKIGIRVNLFDAMRLVFRKA